MPSLEASIYLLMHLMPQNTSRFSMCLEQISQVDCLVVLSQGGSSFDWYWFHIYDAFEMLFLRSVHILMFSRYSSLKHAFPGSPLY